jgi:hypothetical protein
MKQSEARAFIESKVTVDENGCWIWPHRPGTTPRNYGMTRINGKFYAAHRLSYMAYHGRIGKYNVLHHCDVPKCCNPDHLFLGTPADNSADMVAKDRSGLRELNAPKGKLTDAQVKEIREKRQRGIPISWLAKEYGVANSYVRDIVNRREKRGRPTRPYADLL